jgi:hypothetical protein
VTVMKVLHQSDTILMLEDRPWLIGILMIAMALVFAFGAMALIGSGEILGGVFVGLIGVGVPVLLGALFVQRVRLTLDRQSGLVTRTRRSVLGLTQATYPLHRLKGAQVDASTDSDGTTYRMELRLVDPPETVPFTTYYTSGKRPQKVADAVEAWLQAGSRQIDPPQRLETR